MIKGRKKREKIVKGYCFRRKLQSACAVTVHFVHSNALRGTLPVSSNAALLSCLVICCGELRFLSYFVIIKAKDSKTDFYRLTTYYTRSFYMSFWNTLKQKLRSFIPVSRTYMDNKLRELEKENKRQEKIHRNCIAGTTGENGLHRCSVKRKNVRSG